MQFIILSLDLKLNLNYKIFQQRLDKMTPMVNSTLPGRVLNKTNSFRGKIRKIADKLEKFKFVPSFIKNIARDIKESIKEVVTGGNVLGVIRKIKSKIRDIKNKTRTGDGGVLASDPSVTLQPEELKDIEAELEQLTYETVAMEAAAQPEVAALMSESDPPPNGADHGSTVSKMTFMICVTVLHMFARI